MTETIIEGLQPGQTYSARVRTKSEDGQTSEWSNVLTFTTPSDVIKTTNSIVQQYFADSGGIYASSNVFMNTNGIFGYTTTDATDDDQQGIRTLAFSLDANNGRITAQRGAIGGWRIQPGSLSAGTGTQHVELSTVKTGGDSNYAMWAGANDPWNAPFYVMDDGSVRARNITVTGSSNIDAILVMSASTYTLLGGTSGSVFLKAPAVSGSTTMTFPATSGTVAIVSGSIASASNSASLGGQPASYYAPISNPNFLNGASISSSALATQAWVLSQNYNTGSGTSGSADYLGGQPASAYALLSGANFNSASMSGSIIATQAWVQSQGYTTGSGTSGSADYLGGQPASAYALLTGANFTAASVSGSIVATQAWVQSQGYGSGSGTSGSADYLGGQPASAYALLASANFTAASVGGNQIATRSWVQSENYASIVTQSSNYTLQISDNNKLLLAGNGAVSSSVTIPTNSSVAFSIGSQIIVVSNTTASLVIQGASGVTLNYYSPNSSSTLRVSGKNAGVTVTKTGTDEWLALGAIY